MRLTICVALAAVLAAPLAAQRSDSLSREERTRLEERVERLRTELRELERQLAVTRGGFYLRSNDGQPFAWSLTTSNRARLGVVVATGETTTDSEGARLTAVTPNGPASEAGLQTGDVIVRVNGVSLANARPTPGERLIDEVDDLDDGDTVRVEYRRGGDTRSATIVARRLGAPGFGYSVRSPLVIEVDSIGGSAVIELDEAGRVLNRALTSVREMPGFYSSVFTNRWSSMELTTLDADLGRYFGATEGVLVVRPPRDSLLGLRGGDVILRIGGRVPTNPSHAIRILRSYNAGDEIRLDIMRDRRQQTLNATVPEQDRDRGLFWDWN